MSIQPWHPRAEYFIYSILYHQEKSNSYGRKVFENKLFEYRGETNVYVYIDKYDLNPKDISLMGFSQGAILSWSLLLDHPKRFRRAICMSGYINTQLLEKPLDEYQNVLAYASHGTNDPTVPYQWAESGITKLKINNPEIVFNSYRDGHNVSPENFKGLLEWISKTNLD